MSIALLIFCLLPMASRGNLYAQSPNGALQASGKTSVTSHDGNITINLNLNIALQKIKGKRPAGTPTNAPSGSMTTASPSLSPSASTPIPTGAPPPPPGPPPPPTGAPPPPPGPPPPPPTGAPPVLTGAPPAPMGAAPGSPGPDPAGPPAGSPGATFAEEGLQAHNYYRSFHDSPPMTLNGQMNNQATAYANKLAQDGFLMHSPKGEREGQGENLYMGCSSRPGDTAGSVAVKAWYDEVCSPGYPFGSVQSPGSAGHFTQVVWSDSTELGYGKATVIRRGMKCTFVVARYKPRGNVFTGHDDYNKNVKKGSNFDKDNYCKGRKRKGNRFHAKSVFPAERVMLGLPEESTHEQGVLRKGKISQKIANTGFTAYQ